MTINPITIHNKNAEMVVEQAIQAFLDSTLQRPNGTTLTAALLDLEKTAKQARLAIPVESFLGTWQLSFSAGKQAKYQSGHPVGSGFYLPKWAIARITFASDDTQEPSLQIANELCIGPLKIRFTGPARYSGKKNLLAFDFTHLEMACFGVSVYRGSAGRRKQRNKPFEAIAIAKLPFFAFFTATDEYIAARGRGGGLALWVKA